MYGISKLTASSWYALSLASPQEVLPPAIPEVRECPREYYTDDSTTRALIFGTLEGCVPFLQVLAVVFRVMLVRGSPVAWRLIEEELAKSLAQRVSSAELLCRFGNVSMVFRPFDGTCGLHWSAPQIAVIDERSNPAEW